jgi:chemotaxis protein methyltransferase CheR
VYTLALLLKSAIAASARPSVRAWNATVLGTDLSSLMLERAAIGSYAIGVGLDSFRDVPTFARHHFAPIFSAGHKSWSASDELRGLTRFARHNLVTDPPALLDVDLVVCRNTLIYFDEVQSKAALASLEASLRPAGALVLGPAEDAASDARLRLVCAPDAVFWIKEA